MIATSYRCAIYYAASELSGDLMVYAKASLFFSTIDTPDKVIDTLALKVRETPRPALFLARKTLVQYWRRGGARQQVLPDFFIGAHTAVEAWPLLTRDARRFRSCFPGLKVLAP